MSVVDALNEKNALIILRELRKYREPVYLSHLQKVVKNYHVLKNTVFKLSEVGLIKIIEGEYRGRPVMSLTLTEKGRLVANKLFEISSIDESEKDTLSSYDWKESLEFIEFIIKHVDFQIETEDRPDVLSVFLISDENLDKEENVKIIGGKKYAIVELINNPNGARPYLYCTTCESDTCHHISFIWANPKTRERVINEISKWHCR